MDVMQGDSDDVIAASHVGSCLAGMTNDRADHAHGVVVIRSRIGTLNMSSLVS